MKLTELLHLCDCNDYIRVYKDGKKIFKGSTDECWFSHTPNDEVKSLTVEDNTLLVWLSDSQK